MCVHFVSLSTHSVVLLVHRAQEFSAPGRNLGVVSQTDMAALRYLTIALGREKLDKEIHKPSSAELERTSGAFLGLLNHNGSLRRESWLY